MPNQHTAARARAEKALSDHHGARRFQDLTKTNAALLKALADAKARLGDLDALSSAAPKPIVALRGRGRGARRQAVAHVLCSDWHIEERVLPAHVNGINEYSPEIAKACIRRLYEGVEWLIRDTRFDIRKLVVWLGGDLISGYIHEELQEHNFMSPVQATLWLLDELTAFFTWILENTDLDVVVNCNDGNHGRLTHKIRVATRTQNSIEYLLYKTLATRFVDYNTPARKRITFNVAEGEYLYHNVYDFTECFFHGDSVRYQGGIGGLLIPMRRGLNEHRKVRKVDIYNFGHFHTYMDLPDMTGNGSMIGMTPYSLRLKCAPEPRAQAFFLLDSVRGKCQNTRIWLDETPLVKL